MQQISTCKCRCHIPAVQTDEATCCRPQSEPTPVTCREREPAEFVNYPEPFSPLTPEVRLPSVAGCCFHGKSISVNHRGNDVMLSKGLQPIGFFLTKSKQILS